MPRIECPVCGKKHNKPGACKFKGDWWTVHPQMREIVEARIKVYAERAAQRKPLFKDEK